ncbi:helix-turn-helix domain-containing protein [Paenibacillus contaminans]|nr:helix-turn-helix domain-containing protein [Paenibacillus contaminans]
MDIFKSKVFRKMLLTCILMPVVPVLLLGGFNYYQSTKIANQQIDTMNMAMVDRIAEHYDKIFRDFTDIASLVKDLPWLTKIVQMETVDYDRIDINDLMNIAVQLRIYKLNNEVIKNITVVFRDSDLVIDTDTFYDKSHYFSNKYSIHSDGFQKGSIDWEALNTPQFINNFQMEYYGNPVDPTMLFVKPLHPPGSRAEALTLIQIDEAKLKEALTQFKMGEKTTLYILQSNLEYFFSGNEGAKLPSKETLQSQSGSGVLPIGKERFNYYFATSRFNGFKYIAVADSKSVMAQVEYIKKMTYALVICSVIAGFMISYLVALNNYRPIRRLVHNISFPSLKRTHRNEFDLIEREIRTLEESRPIIKNNFLLKLIKGVGIEETNQRSMEVSGLEFPGTSFVVAVMEVEAMDNMKSQEKLTDSELSILTIREIEEYFERHSIQCFALETDPSEYAMILNFFDLTKKQLNDLLVHLLEHLQEKNAGRLELGLACGVGGVYSELNNICTSYREGRKALEYKYSPEPASVTAYADIADQLAQTVHFTVENEIQLIQVAKTGDFAKTEKLLDELLQQNFAARRLDSRHGMYVFTRMMTAAIAVYGSTRGEPSDLLGGYETLQKLKNYHDTVDYIKKVYMAVCQSINENKQKVNENLTKAIVAFIDERCFQPDISLTLLSEQFSYSSVYISRLIKDYVGCNFVDYVNRKRVERAKQLLGDTELLVKDIALTVGFENDITFRRIFKKYEMITPGEYRDGL